MLYDKLLICGRQGPGNLTCSHTSYIHILMAFRGRLSVDVCPMSGSTNNCYTTVTKGVRTLCEGRTACEVEDKGEEWSEKCKDPKRYLEIMYTCVERGTLDHCPFWYFITLFYLSTLNKDSSITFPATQDTNGKSCFQ